MTEPSEDGDGIVWQKASLIPATWSVSCPCCGEEIGIDAVEDDDAGVWHAADDERFRICEHCEAGIEVTGARVVDVQGMPFRQRSGGNG